MSQALKGNLMWVCKGVLLVSHARGKYLPALQLPYDTSPTPSMGFGPAPKCTPQLYRLTKTTRQANHAPPPLPRVDYAVSGLAAARRDPQNHTALSKTIATFQTSFQIHS